MDDIRERMCNNYCGFGVNRRGEAYWAGQGE